MSSQNTAPRNAIGMVAIAVAGGHRIACGAGTDHLAPDPAITVDDVRAAYELLGLQSYFTTLSDEVRAWTIPKGATAREAAGAIHTDFVLEDGIELIQKPYLRDDLLREVRRLLDSQPGSAGARHQRAVDLLRPRRRRRRRTF